MRIRLVAFAAMVAVVAGILAFGVVVLLGLIALGQVEFDKREATLGTFLMIMSLYALIPVVVVVIGPIIGWACGVVVYNFISQHFQHSRAGYCHVCGYCLVGNVSGRCPECGSDVGGRTPSR